MNIMHREYYHQMLLKERLVPIYLHDDLVAMITFYIGDNNIYKYVRDDPWTILDDEPETGYICYVDQLVTNKYPRNSKYSFMVTAYFIQYIQERYPLVNIVRWNRYKNGKVRIYHKDI